MVPIPTKQKNEEYENKLFSVSLGSIISYASKTKINIIDDYIDNPNPNYFIKDDINIDNDNNSLNVDSQYIFELEQ